MGLFKRQAENSGRHAAANFVPRASRGWGETLAFLKEREGLRVLDFGTTSSSNINYLTQLGQTVYMANVVEDSTRADWMRPNEQGKPEFDAEAFAAANFGFSGKEFDAVLLWDTADYLPPAAVPLLYERLRASLHPGGRLLAFSHGKTSGPETQFYRYHITDHAELLLQHAGEYPVQAVYQTRQIERFLEGYGDVRFYLGKDNTREIIATR